MKPIETVNTNLILTGTTNVIAAGTEGGQVHDPPAVTVRFDDGSALVESCWQLSEKELEEVNKTGRIYLLVMGHTHPPAIPSTSSIVDEEGGSEQC